eukprot:gnl/TRDRNA2_/TRDRNA2_34860_c0_seq1.p1 gnl/TRDRNA2_/TRDRNA2_34860_c0~~gnl/TRDRNA2_/TRDRNA2_34860_c0_seq1.p1  ORF type:complete len:186 (-),score=26.21 gnl/TRDRNA2_/TRDRNA2_34860_c0_seq1:80-637(-)
MVGYVDEHAAGVAESLELIPGVTEAMRCLVAAGAHVGLVTGNVERIAWAKMAAVGLTVGPGGHFSAPAFGGFGSDVMASGVNEEAKVRDRGEQVKLAIERGKGSAHEVAARCYHIGDAPADVCAAAYAGATPIGVTTGKFSAEELRAACPEAIVLESLEDLPRFLTVIGLDYDCANLSSGGASNS